MCILWFGGRHLLFTTSASKLLVLGSASANALALSLHYFDQGKETHPFPSLSHILAFCLFLSARTRVCLTPEQTHSTSLLYDSLSTANCSDYPGLSSLSRYAYACTTVRKERGHNRPLHFGTRAKINHSSGNANGCCRAAPAAYSFTTAPVHFMDLSEQVFFTKKGKKAYRHARKILSPCFV